MWCMIDSLRSVVDGLADAFTRPSFDSTVQLLLGWIMCLGKHTLDRVAHSAQPRSLPDHSARHGLDGYYNFFERSAWTPAGLAYHIGVLLLTRLQLFGRITLLVDDTLAHKRGKCVWGLGWWRDAVASTKKRVATASGHNWVVLAVAYALPGCHSPILALPLLARLHLPGKGQPSCPALAKAMLAEVLEWFPKHTFTLVGDGVMPARNCSWSWTAAWCSWADCVAMPPCTTRRRRWPKKAGVVPRRRRERNCPSPRKRRPRPTANGRASGHGCGNG